MNWKKTTVERQQLFDEVWATPVSKLAKSYGLSDVGLRKICLTLEMLLPPRGYWQKLAAGTKIPKLALHETTVATTYARTMHVASFCTSQQERMRSDTHLCVHERIRMRIVEQYNG